MFELIYKDLGLMDYCAALTIQERIVEFKQREPSPDILLFVEHPHVYTLGRGGDVTYHGPGQLVVYPIIDLRSKLRKDVHRYLRNLEMTAIRTLEDFSLTGSRRLPFTGIWVGDRKIAAIGVAVRRCITYHGLALNVNTDLSYFQRIVPCGLAWAEVTSMARELGTQPDQREVRDSFLRHFAELFDYSDVKESHFAEDREWRMEDCHLPSSILHLQVS